MTMPNQRIDEGERGQLGVAFGRARRAPPQGSSWSLDHFVCVNTF